MTTNDLLHEMLSELAAPMLLIGRDKCLHFASPAFRRLVAFNLAEIQENADTVPPAQVSG